ncbi:MsnO8 family LLM class oxidoreductase [Rahnella variigena]|uniref:Alkane 1-monooxygenase n=1 Tax=Rahnella variigena TaxID=574964 RepID=A0ABX9Q1D6_9GAMM|nr:MsnO8 family LLM class oxidoreductase [Rahnella variigena]MDH2897030.1 MsnO8 family LLM class oxidoreductase [Rahnella variigena]RJT50784.1 MsnO8 family LLM class oxidoreductase [Rahnella variigena]RKF70985.1 alkane 1-monooxygenase [Rahnella variigena]
MNYRLSLLDQSPINDGQTAAQALEATLTFAQKAEALGYHRLWVSEHHDTERLAGSSPEVLIAWLLARTSRLRIGSGGVMLQHYSPYKVAENFHLLASLAPDRVDIGIGKAPGGLPLSTKALRGHTPADSAPGFPAQLQQLTHYLTHLDDHLAGTEARALPSPPVSPQRFLLGASPESARLAASLGWNFVFAGFINTSEQVMTESVLAFHEYSAGQGQALVSLAVLAAETRERAEALVAEQHNFRVTVGDRHVTVGTREQAEAFVQQAGATHYQIEQQKLSVLHGTPGDIHQQLRDIQRRLCVNEFVIHTPLTDAAVRLKSIELLAGQH